MNEYLKKYRENRVLGFGYNSQHVYKVTDYENKSYVLKFITFSSKNKESSVRREKKILQEALPDNFIRLLGYENIVVNENTILTVLKFDYYPTDLKLYLHSNNSIKNSTLRKWARQICEGMNNLHKQHILHRDLKPENILLTELSENADVVIADLGFCINTDHSNPKTVLGTANYIAPEVIRQKNYNEKIDIYSYGALVYYMLFKNTVVLNNRNEIQYPSHTDPDLSTREFLSKALQYNPENRASFEELLKFNFLNFTEEDDIGGNENFAPAKILEPEFFNDSDESDEESKIDKQNKIVQKELKKFNYIKAALYYLHRSGPTFLEKFTSETKDVFEMFFHKFSKSCAKKIHEKFLAMRYKNISDEINNLKVFIESERKRVKEIRENFTEPITTEIKRQMQNFTNMTYTQFSQSQTNDVIEKIFYEILRNFNSYLKKSTF